MSGLSLLNIESELSYAYLHAVASKAGMSCKIANRHEDNAGIDAQITAWGPFPAGGWQTEVDLKIQLKATIAKPADDGTFFSYFLQGVRRYDFLREETRGIHRVLIVLFLPVEHSDWLSHSAEELALRRCAYWVSLRGAPETTNSRGQTIKIPKKQVLTPDALLELMAGISRNRPPAYEAV
jgi:hypothetical protein